jgi:transcriptional regulator
MVMKYEAPDSSYSLQDVDAEFLSGMNKGVQGFKIKINKIEGKAKLSQNHSLQRQELVINQLEQISNTDEQQISSLMKANLKKYRLNVISELKKARLLRQPFSYGTNGAG